MHRYPGETAIKLQNFSVCQAELQQPAKCFSFQASLFLDNIEVSTFHSVLLKSRHTMAIKTLTVKTVSILMWIYDVMTLPIYWMVQKPWITRRKRNDKHRITTQLAGNNRIKIQSTLDKNCETGNFIRQGDGTLTTFLDLINQKYGLWNCMGQRKVLSIMDGSFNGMPVKKISKEPEYSYITYNQMMLRTRHLACGLIKKFNLKPQEIILIFGNTSMEWTLTALASIRAGCLISTLVPSMTEEAVVGGMSQLLPKLIITESSLLAKAFTCKDKVETLKDVPVVCLDDCKGQQRAIPLKEIEDFGLGINIDLHKPSPDDPALIMYTSGTTAKPERCHHFPQKHPW